MSGPIKVSVLVGDLYTPNSLGIVTPLVIHRKILRSYGIQISIFRKICPKLTECDVLILDSKYFRDRWVSAYEECVEELTTFKAQVNQLWWFNSADSAGSIQNQVMPLVDKYIKAQLYRNRNLYSKSFYGGRVFTDFYHSNLGVDDSISSYSKPLSIDEVSKLKLGWNFGLAGLCSQNAQIRARAYRLTKIDRCLRYRKPRCSSDRGNMIFTRLNTNYSLKTISYQRERTLDILRELGFSRSNRRVSRSQFYNELGVSRAALSPFGYGEINIRDFECFSRGVLLIKPDVSHLETFPSFYQNTETYVPFRWDFSDFEEVLSMVTSGSSQHEEIARAGQERFLAYTSSNGSAEKFTKHFLNLFHV